MTGDRAHWRPEELELLELVAEGQENKEIAARLGVSETTIKKRLGRLMRRLDATNRVQLVRAAIRLHLVRDEG